MNKKIFFILLTLILATFLFSYLQPNKHNSLVHSIQIILHSNSDNPNIGIIIKNLKTNKILYQLNPTRSFTAASTTKILTATAALNFLGPHYYFITTLSATSNKIKNRQLNGNLDLHFSGDPSLTFKDLKNLLNILLKRKIHIINGNITINVFPFTTLKQGPGYMWDDFNLCYSTKSNAIVLNHNCFKFTLYPNKKLGKKAKIVPNHFPYDTSVKNSVVTKKLSNKPYLLSLTHDRYNHYQLTGFLDKKSRPLFFNVAIHDPRYLLRQFLEHWLKKHHIKLTGKIIYRTKKSKQAIILAQHKSAPLYYLIKHMLITSDNLYANNIFKTIGAIYLNKTANWENGTKAEIDILKKLNINLNKKQLVDGAGLSRYNYFSPHILMQALTYNFKHPKTKPYFYNGLSIVGINGIFKHRKLNNNKAHFHVKTGSMRFVANTAGYLTTSKGTTLAIVIMINGNEKSKIYFDLSLKIINLLTNYR